MEALVYTQFYELEQEHWWFRGMRILCRDLLHRLPLDKDTGMKCLDVGCGTGLWTKELESFGHVCGLDVAPEALDFCKKRGIHRLVRGTAEHLPFRAESQGLITAIGVIEHLEDEKGFLSELFRVCKPGGYVLFLTSAYDFLWSQHDEVVHHKRRYLKGQFARLLAASGFEVVRCSYVNTFLFFPIIAVRLIQRLTVGTQLARNGTPDVFMPPSLINRLLYRILWMESRLLNFVSLPFGVGLLAITRKSTA